MTKESIPTHQADSGLHRRVVVVGGGYAGTALARLLDDSFAVTLIEKKEVFFHNVGALRGIVDEQWPDRLFIPYDHLLKHGHILHDSVADITPQQVVLASGKQVGYDYLVLATGSSYPAPAKMHSNDIETTKQHFLELHGKVRAAHSVLIIGGGPVGVELAGEISSAYPDKSITLVHADAALIGPPFHPKLGKLLHEKLRAKNVRILLGERVLLNSHSHASDYVEQTTFLTDKGTKIKADITFFGSGSQPNTDYLRPHYAHLLDDSGRIKVNRFLQVEGFTNLFAIGDVTNLIEPKMAFTGEAHAKVVAANIKVAAAAQLRGTHPTFEHGKAATRARATLKAYKPSSAFVIVVPVGPDDGAAQLPLGPGGAVLGAWAARRIKSKTLLVDRYRQKLAAPA